MKAAVKGKAAAEKTSGPSLSLEKKGSYVYWFTYTDSQGAQQSSLPVRFKGKSTDLDTKALGQKYSDAQLYVMDKATGNAAIADYPPAKGKDVNLTEDDFQYIRTVRLRIVAEDGKPVESALVHITDGMNTKMTALVTPADEGVATFFDVAAGETSVRVDAENLRKTIDSDVEIPDSRKTPEYERDIKVAGDVNTVTPKAKPGAGVRGEKESSGGGALTAILSTFAGLIILIVIIAVVIVVLKAKGVTAKSALQGLGAELPGDAAQQQAQNGSAPQGPAVDPNVCPFCGQRKDANGRCACSVVPGMAPATASAASPSVPRLVGTQGVYAGHIFELTSSVMIIGRESDNQIALPNDSTASRRHATISQVNGGFLLQDEGSSNGTFINGAKITQQALAAGDEVQIGGTKFRFEV